MNKKDEKFIGAFAHASGLIMGFLGPLIIFIILHVLEVKEGAALKNTRHALNFQLSLLIYYLLSAILMLVIIGFFMMSVLMIFSVIVIIIAIVKASKGEEYKYPLEIRFFR